MNKDMNCSEGRFEMARLLASQWSGTISKLMVYFGWPLIWVLSTLGIWRSLHKHIFSSCKEVEQTNIVQPVLMHLCIKGIDFSFPKGYKMLIKNTEISEMWAAWCIIFVDEQHQQDNEKEHLEGYGYHCGALDFEISEKVPLASLELSNCCVLQEEEISLANDDKPDFEFCSTSEDSFDSDYSDTESLDESDCVSFATEDSDDEFSVVFADDCNVAKDQCNLAALPAIVMNFQTCNNSSIIFEDIPDFSLHGLVSSYSHGSYVCVEQSIVCNGMKSNIKTSCNLGRQKNSAPSKDDTASTDTASTDTSENSDLRKKCKKTVAFAAEKELVTIHPMVKWSFAYQAARKGCWQTCALDRAHFHRKIQQCEEILEPVLKNHCQRYLASC